MLLNFEINYKNAGYSGSHCSGWSTLLETDQGSNSPSHARLGRIIPHDGEYHAIGAGKMRSRAGSAGEALVEIQGTERPTALADSARSATVRFPEA